MAAYGSHCPDGSDHREDDSGQCIYCGHMLHYVATATPVESDETQGYAEYLDMLETYVPRSEGTARNGRYGLEPIPVTTETRADGSFDLAWHRNTGERCKRAETSMDCPENHRYGQTFDTSH